MWVIDPRIMCRKHLLGEHVELHMFLSSMKRGLDLSGYARNNLFEPRSLEERHRALAIEMRNRGYRHASPMPHIVFKTDRYPDTKVDSISSLADLLTRCSVCKARYDA